MLIFGVIRDYAARLFGLSRYKQSIIDGSKNGYSPFVFPFDGFFTRRMYVLLAALLSAPDLFTSRLTSLVHEIGASGLLTVDFLLAGTIAAKTCSTGHSPVRPVRLSKSSTGTLPTVWCLQLCHPRRNRPIIVNV